MDDNFDTRRYDIIGTYYLPRILKGREISPVTARVLVMRVLALAQIHLAALNTVTLGSQYVAKASVRVPCHVPSCEDRF